MDTVPRLETRAGFVIEGAQSNAERGALRLSGDMESKFCPNGTQGVQGAVIGD
jgi:hypothetical protein